MAIKPKLTMKQAKFVRGIAEGKPEYKAALDAYDIKSKHQIGTASAIASENLEKPRIQEAIEKARVKLNLTPERALKPIDDALNSDDLEMRLKGTDRWMKLLPKDKEQPNTINFINNATFKADKYKK